MPDNLKFTDRDGKDWSISNLPTGLMDQFIATAAEIYPNTENPWMHFLLDTIASACDMDRAVFQMTDIPHEAIEGLEDVAKQCDYNRYSLFSVILQAAQANNLVLGRLHTDQSAPGESISVIITGIPTASWQSLEEQAAKAATMFGERKPSAIGILMLLFEFAKNTGFVIEHKAENNLPKGAKGNAKSRSKPVGRGRFGGD